MNIPSWLNIKELDKWLKENKWYVGFGLFELDKELNNNILSYFTSNKNLVFEYNWITVYLIRSTYAKKEFNRVQIFLENINLYLTKRNINLYWIEKIINGLNEEDFSRASKAWRILRYLQQYIYKTRPIDTTWLRNNKQLIVLWDEQINNGTRNKNYWILDCFFNAQQKLIWQPVYNEKIIWQKLKELEVFKTINQKYFDIERKIGYDPTDNQSLYNQYISFLNSKSSAKIEWYLVDNLNSLSKIQLSNKLKKTWGKDIQAVANIQRWSEFISKNSFNAHKNIDLGFINDVQRIVVEKTWTDNEPREDKTPGYFRNFEIWVFDAPNKKIYPSKSWIKTNKAFIAPKYTSVKALMETLVDFYNSNIWKIDDYILSVLLKLMFVIIHPYGDWNWRTSRLLFEWSLINTGWIENGGLFPLSYTINNHKQKYYDALQKTTEPSLYHIDCYDDYVHNCLVVNYESEDVFTKLDLTPFLVFSIELWKMCFVEAMFEYKYFKTREDLIANFEKTTRNFNKNEKMLIKKTVVAQLKNFDWGKATNERLKFLSEDELSLLKNSVLKVKNQLRFLNIDWINQEEQSLLEQAIKEYIKYF